MTLRTQISRLVSTAWTSAARRDLRCRVSRARRRLSGASATVHYFHQADDPYSHLAAQCLVRLAERYRIELAPHLVAPPDDAAAPERARLEAYALRDAARLARRHGLSFPDEAVARDPDRVRAADAELAQAIGSGSFADAAVRAGEALWRGRGASTGTAESAVARQALAEGTALRGRLGHYLGGMLYFDGEWYWGVDRLHHLETRLRQKRLVNDPGSPRIAPFQEMALDGRRAARPPRIDFWFSFRSPYSCIAAPRVHRLAAYYGAEVRWRFILPMVMRGLPVPAAKRRYIMLDAKREAEVLGLRFGTAVDPVGEGVERALAVLHRAIPLGRGAAFMESGLQAALADGLDLASDDGLRRATHRAGLSDADVTAALADESWRPAAEENREALFAAGLWGAPTCRVDGMPAHWGQDRLWALEEDLKASIAAET